MEGWKEKGDRETENKMGMEGEMKRWRNGEQRWGGGMDEEMENQDRDGKRDEVLEG